jgi:hypothetical protein
LRDLTRPFSAKTQIAPAPHPLRKGTGQRLAISLQNPAFGDQSRYQARRRHVEGVVGDWRAFRDHPHRLDPPVRGAPGHGGDFVGGALLDCPDYVTGPARSKNRDAPNAEINKLTAKKFTESWVKGAQRRR